MRNELIEHIDGNTYEQKVQKLTYIDIAKRETSNERKAQVRFRQASLELREAIPERRFRQ